MGVELEVGLEVVSKGFGADDERRGGRLSEGKLMLFKS